MASKKVAPKKSAKPAAAPKKSTKPDRPDHLATARAVVKAARLTKTTVSLSEPKGYEAVISNGDGRLVARVRALKDGKIRVRRGGVTKVVTSVAEAAKAVKK